MNESFLEILVFWVMGVISNLGYPGIFLLMALESALIPIPSEVIMPFSGFLVSQGSFNLLAVVLAGALGNLAGSWGAYALGHYGEKLIVRNLIKKYGRYILLSEEEFDNALRLFSKYGQWVTAIARVLPAVRTVISLPAGVAKLSFWKFSLLTFFGSFVWSYFLTLIGVALGENWYIIRPYFRKFDILIIVLTIIFVGAYIYHKIHKKKKTSEIQP